jgi:hypothetical protein
MGYYFQRLIGVAATAFLCLTLTACSDGEVETSSLAEQDITNAEFTSRNAPCDDYVGYYTSDISDVGNSTNFSGNLYITAAGDTCTLTTNSIPNHDVNDATSFATDVGTVTKTYQVTTSPSDAASTTDLSLEWDDAIFLNGAKLDLLPAACYGVGTDPLGSEKTGCETDGTPWRYDPMFSGNDFGTDSHNAHTQPNGAYHYHGDPLAMYDDSSPTVDSPVIGFAADGYPIYGPYIDDSGVRLVTSGYTLKSGSRVSQTGEGAFPGGTYDGTFRDDWEYTAGGDLDECNGMTRSGQYGYYVTRTFPWVLNCFKGTPDSSFEK